MTPATDTAPDAQDPQLQRSLKPRHITMIALGGIIGAGLFVGSSAVIGSVGPGAVVSYLIPSLISLAIVLAAAFLRGRADREPATAPARSAAGAARPDPA